MARETKFGVALMVLLLGVFAAVAYKKWDGLKSVVQTARNEASPANDAASAKDGHGKSSTSPEHQALQPEDNPFAATEAPIAGLPNGQSASEDPFGAAAPSAGQVPVRAVSMSSADPLAADSPFGQSEPTPSEPPAQAEPVDQSPFEPANVATAADAAPFQRSEPATTASDALAETATTKSQSEPSTAATPDEDPFGAVAATAPADPLPAAEPADDSDPFGAASDAVALVETAPAAVADSAPPQSSEPAPAAASTGSSNAAEPPTAVATAPTKPTVEEDPFGQASDAESQFMADGNGTESPFLADAAQPMPSDAPSSPETSLASQPEPSAAPAEPATAEASPMPTEDPFGAVAQSEPAPIAEAAEKVESLFDDPEASKALVRQPEPTTLSAPEFAASEPAPSPRTPAQDASASPVQQRQAAPAEVGGQSDYVTAGQNESYWTISKRVYGTPIYFHALAKHNERRIPDPKKLRAGMSVLTPPAAELQASYPKLISQGAAPAESTAKSGFLVDAAGRPAYRVGADDTLGKIAQIHLGRASRWVQIYEMNRAQIPDVKALKPGTVLRLPADASRVRLVPQT